MPIFFTKQEIHVISLLLLAALVVGFLTGSIWIFTAALSALMAKMFPVLLLAVVLVGGGFLAFKYYWRQ